MPVEAPAVVITSRGAALELVDGGKKAARVTEHVKWFPAELRCPEDVFRPSPYLGWQNTICK